MLELLPVLFSQPLRLALEEEFAGDPKAILLPEGFLDLAVAALHGGHHHPVPGFLLLGSPHIGAVFPSVLISLPSGCLCRPGAVRVDQAVPEVEPCPFGGLLGLLGFPGRVCGCPHGWCLDADHGQNPRDDPDVTAKTCGCLLGSHGRRSPRVHGCLHPVAPRVLKRRRLAVG